MSITAANAIIQLAVASVFPTPQQIQQFAADDVFSTDPIESSETSMGVDGVLTAGFVFVPIKWSITLQADSPSNRVFDDWWAAQQAAKEIFSATGIVMLTSLRSKWNMVNGKLGTFSPMPDAGKTLKPRKFSITWESISKAPTT